MLPSGRFILVPRQRGQVNTCPENTRDCLCCRLGCECSVHTAGRDNYGNLAVDEIGRKSWQLLVLAVCPVVFNFDIAPVVIAYRANALQE